VQCRGHQDHLVDEERQFHQEHLQGIETDNFHLLRECRLLHGSVRRLRECVHPDGLLRLRELGVCPEIGFQVGHFLHRLSRH
jgi:hypothetical protein